MNPDVLRTHLSAFLRADEIPNDPEPFLCDQRRRYRSENVVVVMPSSVAAVQNIVRFCAEHRIPITPQGGNTGLVGGTFAQSGVLLNLGKLNKIRSLSLEDNAMTVEAGCILRDVQQRAEHTDRLFPLSLASEGSCQIGGNIACNAGGLNVLRYGTMRDLVLGLEMVLPDGSLVSHLSPLHKNTTGYDLRHLFIGSEGTLGVITAATIKLFARPKIKVAAWVGLPDVEAAVCLLTLIQGHFAQRLCSFELMSAVALGLSAQFCGQSAPLQAAYHVLLELEDGVCGEDLGDDLAQFLWQHGFSEAILAQSEAIRADFWRLRESISAAQSRLGVSIKHDIALPITRVAAFMRDCEADLAGRFEGAMVVAFGHLGDGSLHYNVFLAQRDSAVYAHEQAVNRVVYAHVLAHDGTIAAEHGIGCLKNHWLGAVRSASELRLMRAIKRELDPHDLFNRGKLLPNE